MTPRYRGRFAPSPTGPLHLGSVAAALASFADAHHANGDWLVRIEDLDPPREPEGARDQILRALIALSLVPDEAALLQSQRLRLYDITIERLLISGDAFECRCSRSDLSATSGIHRGFCRNTSDSGPAAIRLRVPDVDIEFQDRIQGLQKQNLLREVGDFVLRRRDGLIAYQLAVVVDDGEQGITHVVRGSDLLDSTARQIFLQSVLGLNRPSYAHIPVLTDASGAKLSKQNLAPAISTDDALSTLIQAAHWLQPGITQKIMHASNAREWLEEFVRAWRLDQVPRTPAVCVSG